MTNYFLLRWTQAAILDTRTCTAVFFPAATPWNRASIYPDKTPMTCMRRDGKKQSQHDYNANWRFAALALFPHASFFGLLVPQIVLVLDVVACASVLADAGTQIRLAATVASRTCLACLPSFSLSHDSLMVRAEGHMTILIILSTLPSPRVNITICKRRCRERKGNPYRWCLTSCPLTSAMSCIFR